MKGRRAITFGAARRRALATRPGRGALVEPEDAEVAPRPATAAITSAALGRGA
jgi:hypothetical protein